MILKNKYFILSQVLFLLLIMATTAASQPPYIDSLKRVIIDAQANPKPNKSDVKAAIVLIDYYSKISFDTARYYGKTAYDISLIVGNDTGIAVSLNSIGMLYESCGYFDSAFPYLDSSRAMFANMGDMTGLIFVRNNLAVAMMRKGNYPEALKYYQDNLTIAESHNDLENMILSYNNMGITYFDWKKYNQALEIYHLALGVLDKLGEEERKGSVYNNIGEVYFDMGIIDTALIYFNKALKINNKYGKKRSILISITNIGDVHFADSSYNDALKSYQKALKISESIPEETQMAIINIKIGNLYNAIGSYNKAYSFLNKGLQMSLAAEMSSSVLKAYVGLIDYARGIKNVQKVYDYGKLYIRLKDSLFNNNSLSKISELETRFKTVQKEKEIVVLKADQKVKYMEIQLQKKLQYGLAILILVLLLTAILLFNRYKLKKDKEKSEIEKERIQIEQRLLRSQMNPHFIFNSLNSINSFIGDNNPKEAQIYLTKFAKLMRLILENSRKVMVTLEDEVNALLLNLELEQLRFDGRFDFSINIDNNIDPEDVYLPPMLIQPFVENAIKHGIKGKEGKGLITISISTEHEFLKCIVEDNGIGREKTMKIGHKNKDHASLGTQVTIERLQILKQEKIAKTGIKIIDLKNEKGIGIGTRVVLHIPFEEE